MKLAVEACGSVRRLDAILNYEIKVQRNEEAESKEKIKTPLESTKPKKKKNNETNRIELPACWKLVSIDAFNWGARK